MAKTLEQRIEDLQKTLETGEKFADTIDKLFLLAEIPEFINQSEPKENEILEAVVSNALNQVVTHPEEILLNLVCLEKFGLYHGSIIVGSTPGVLLYFEGIQMGMLGIPKNSNGEVSYLRFTADIMMEGTFPGKFRTTQND